MKNKKILIIIIFILLFISIFVFKNYFSLKNRNLDYNYIYNEEYSNNNDDYEDEYYLTVNGNATYKTNDINIIYNDADLVIIGEYTNDVDVSIKKNSTPITLSSFKVNKVIKNKLNLDLSNSINVKYSGGVITVKQLLDSRDQDFALKLGLDKLSNTDTNNLKVKFDIDSELGDKPLKKWKTRLLLLAYNKNTNQFEAIQNGYGMLSYNSNDNTAFDIKTKEYITYSFLK